MEKYLIKIKLNTLDYSAVSDPVFTNTSAPECERESPGKQELETMGGKRKREAGTYEANIAAKQICVQEIQNRSLKISPYSWRLINTENLKLKYTKIFSKSTADNIFQKLEEQVEYFSGDLLKVKVYGKWHNIPRKQVSFGDDGLSYSFSGTCVPAVSWSKCNIIKDLKKIIESVSELSFNFVLVNRYKDGRDHMGEHRDDEKDLVQDAPIASLSFGQTRDFIFKHKDSRGAKCLRKIDPVKLELEHGSLLLMEWPTNKFWYHSLPIRKKAPNVRINLTFRKMMKKV